MKKVKKQNSKGITLIALVITIIVLLILAGISISMLTGQNGILQQASEAKERTEAAQTEEQTALSTYEDYIYEYTSEIEVEQVMDTNPGVLEGSGTETDPYVINSIEDLVFFAHDVTNGNNYEGKYVTLGLSLDFNSTKSYVNAYRTDYGTYGYERELKTLLTSGEGFKPIGITTVDGKTNNWSGIFNGNGNCIFNLYINITDSISEFRKIGLFANNYGTISNLKVLNVNLYLNSNNGSLAGITGQNSSTGNIQDCFVSGNITNESLQAVAGGITCYSSGNIQSCANIANVSIKTKGNLTSSSINAGGVCSNTGTSTKIEECFNSGKIEVSNSGENFVYVGGIVGWINSGAELNNCYNTGLVVGNAKKLSIGGITGQNMTMINNCYSTGEVEGTATETLRKGMLIGRNIGNISNLYYLKINEITGIGTDSIGVDSEMAKTESFMKSKEFIDLLNQVTPGIWKEDLNKINNGYPILFWQREPTMGN